MTSIDISLLFTVIHSSFSLWSLDTAMAQRMLEVMQNDEMDLAKLENEGMFVSYNMTWLEAVNP